ncbi:selenocysteine lyase isoform X2 [Cuculus canorus]|uniref:selenocysteine lyase isoform X2 n=1 Tax=Cuculus canorus TaxID=55661 RepID=UPI0023AAB7EE|nr:selenocysteine lyase isoform X2 [Cuculus canorus]XP_053930365.1 selenocysteine lyase isoform X2 [Cuculus canorus]XP_053930366.1 selenocysteine lyase isoform X2 [Cuculus canorus]XP_053930367.1 selenocysteine lyase isoform X2 [Cuculus canorus]XP_053930368.1 selenocysteine lyase isoform X2 [Cuculus canorus]XP_053930369.1 selenocysteine lyase isoform X2 [Cuculus canorus]
MVTETAVMGAGTEPLEARCDTAEGVYLDYNATTPLAPEVAQAVQDAMCQAWGNPSSSHPTGRKAKELIGSARESLARMVGSRPEDIVFTSGGTEANNMVIRTACRQFQESQAREGGSQGTPHIVTSSVEHDSIRLPLEQLVKESLAETTFVPVSPQSGRAEVDEILAAIRPTTCLVSIMLANNETGIIMPVAELSQQICALNQRRVVEGLPRILVHTDAAQMIGKGRVDVRELGVDYLTIVGHKFYGPRIGALYVRGPGTTTPLHPMLFGGGQERSFRPGTENTPMIAGLGQAAELVSKNWEAYEAHMQDVRDYLEARLEATFGKQRIHFNSHFMGSKRLCNTSNFSVLGPGLQGRRVLSRCKVLLASVGAACHSEKGDRPSSILLSCGIPYDVAQNALRLSVGRDTTRADVDLVMQDLVQAVAQLDQDQAS